jgi:hypothetical protein
MIMLLYVPLLAADSKAGEQNINTLPWEIIAEKFDAKKPFCTVKSKDKKTINFALTPDALTITLPSNSKIPQEQTEAKLDLSVWQQGQWTGLPPLTVQIEANSIKVDGNAIANGFYNLSIAFDRNDIGKENNFCAVVATDWKKDLFAWCLKNKEQIETNPDSQLIHSSIAVSHFDNLMELAGKPELSENILSSLSKSIKAKADFQDGKCPDLVIGLNKIKLRRFKGAIIAEFAVRVPESYDNSRKWPMFLNPDPQQRRKYSSSGTGFIDIWWHFPLPMSFEWKDYKYLLSILDKKLNIDEDRIYIYGRCGNAISTMALALNFPDEWAECSLMMGNSKRHLAGNALNLPLIFVKGPHEGAGLKGYYDFAEKCFQYYGCKHFKSSKTQGFEQIRGSSTPEVLRENSPRQVLYRTESLGNSKAYWVQIDGREDENLIGTIDASVDGQTIFVETNNVDAYSLDITQAPVDSNKPVEVVENGQSLGFVTDQVFTKRVKKYIDVVFIKNERLHGPIWDVFTDSYVVIRGTGTEDSKFIEATEILANSLSGGAPIFSDSNLPEELISTHNLILIGKVKSDLRLSRICKELPVQIKESRLTANGKCYDDKNMGFVLIYPNPINPERYVAVFSATSVVAMSNIPDAYSQMKSLNPADVGIFEVVEKNEVKWHIIEKFNTVWGWHDEWSQVLAVTTKKHPKWQWHQWVGKVVREQLKADVVVCENVFKFEDSALGSQLTCRDLFNSFKNDWIIKILIDGESLKDLLAVSFRDISKREVAPSVIYGVNFVKPENDHEETALVVNELENNKKYTIALPYKAINGERMGILLEDYKITGEGYLVLLLKDYLYKNQNLDIDAQLDNLKFNIF